MNVSPWFPLNLNRNPFGEPPVAELPSLIVTENTGLFRWFGSPRRAVQFIGDAGRGKTAHLHALRAGYPGDPYLYLGEELPLPPVPPVARLFLDEAQRLPPRSRRRVFRRIPSIALATHQDLEKELVQAGHEVRTVRVSGLTATRLQSILSRRLEWARREPGEIPEVGADAAWRLLERHGDDLRGIIDLLYEKYQQMATGRDLPAEWKGKREAPDEEGLHGQV
jgi:hypothetical protein